MNSFSTILLISVVSLLGFGGYYYLDQISPMQAALEESRQKNQELVFQVELLQHKNETLSAQLEAKMAAVSEEKSNEIKKLKTTYEDLIRDLKEQVEAGEVTITRLADQLNVKIVDRIIFPSGKAELSPAGAAVLRRIGGILKKATGKRIRVEGHTDNVPIHPRLQNEFPSNWELSAARATNVVHFLNEVVGIDARNLEAVGLGQYRPVATNRTRRGRARNRRIEILLMPEPDAARKLAAARPRN